MCWGLREWDYWETGENSIERIFMICTYYWYNFVDVKEGGIDGQYCMNVGEEKCIQSFVGGSEVNGPPSPSLSCK